MSGRVGRPRALAPHARRFASEGPPLESHRSHRKDRQLCRQVQRILDLALIELEDPDLSGIQILEVTPAPDSSRLRVLLTADRARDRAARAAVSSALARVSARLRVAVGSAIARRRVPELVFFLGTGEAP